MLCELRHARCGYLLALHILLLCAQGHTPTEMVSDVKWHLKSNGPWPYQLSSLYYTPEVSAAVAELCDMQKLKAA
jgi:hypothetical protein